jgi:hypothetical protein
MISKKEVVNGVFSFLSEGLKKNGFEPKISDQFFLKSTQQGLANIDVHFYERTNLKTGAKGFLVEPHIWIGIDEIEQIYRQITVNTSLKKKTDFITLGNKLANLEANPDGISKKMNESLDLFVFETKNINYVSFEILSHLKKTAFPYIERNLSTVAADTLLNMHPREYCVHMRNDVYRIVKGLIAATLTNNPKFESLMEIYSNLIVERQMPDNCKEELSNLNLFIKEFLTPRPK